MAATNTMSSTAPVQRGVMGSKREMPASSGLAANTTSTPRGKRISRGKSTAPTPSATHTRKIAPPNTVPKATGAVPLAPAASPTATFSTSKPDRTAPTAKAESRNATDRPTSPSKSRSVAQIASKTPMTNRAMPRIADIISPNMLFSSLSAREGVSCKRVSSENSFAKASEPRGTAQSHQDTILKKDEFGGSQWY